MKVLLKVLAVLISLFGLLLIVIGISSLTIVETSVEIMKIMRSQGSTTLDGIDISTLRVVLYITAGLTTVIGLSSIVSGAGMFFQKNWARLLWIGTLIVQSTWMLYSFVMKTINGVNNFETVLSYFLSVSVLIVLIYFFFREKTRVYFKVS